MNISTIIALNISVNTTLKYNYSQALNEKIKLMGGATKVFWEKLLGHGMLSSMVHWATKYYLKNLEDPPAPLLIPCTVPM